MEKQQKEKNKLNYHSQNPISQNLLEEIKQKYNITEQQLTPLLRNKEETIPRMKLTKKRIISIVLIVFITLALSGIYISKSGSEKFALLDVNNLDNINDPALRTAIEATEECNKIETRYKNETELYKNDCYQQAAWRIGEYYGITVCEKLKEKFRLNCYQGYGRSIGEKYSPNIKIIQDECSKTAYYEKCLHEASLGIGKESSKHIETEQCQGFEQESIKQRCYDGIGRQLATDNKEQSLCRKVKNKDACLLGFAYDTDIKGNRKEALQICEQLNEEYAKKCYSQIGRTSVSIYGQTIGETFRDCEQYPYSEMCKQGAATGVANKFFEGKQKNKETNSVTGAITFAIYKTINPQITKIGLIVKQQLIPHFINYKLTYLTIILSSLGIIIIIRILKNEKVQKNNQEHIQFLNQKTINNL